MKRQSILDQHNNSAFKIKINSEVFTGVVLQEGAKGYWMVANVTTREKFYNVPSASIKVEWGVVPNPWIYA
jgi:hypothetical protein